jgi:hypothetical protein
MELNYNLCEIVFGYINYVDKMKIIKSDVFNKNVCFDQLIGMDNKNNLIVDKLSKLLIKHNGSEMYIPWQKQLYLKYCNVCRSHQNINNICECDQHKHHICLMCDNEIIDICNKCMMHNNRCKLCVIKKCYECSDQIELLKIDF